MWKLFALVQEMKFHLEIDYLQILQQSKKLYHYDLISHLVNQWIIFHQKQRGIKGLINFTDESFLSKNVLYIIHYVLFSLLFTIFVSGNQLFRTLNPTVTIKLKPYLQEFFRSQYGTALSSRKNFFGLLLQQFVTYRPANARPDGSGPAYMTIELVASSDFQIRNGTGWISPDKQTDLERIALSHFKTVFYAYMDDRVRQVRSSNDGTIKDCILNFCLDYAITPNTMNYETMKKAYYRHELLHSMFLQKKTEKVSNTLSRGCPLIFRLNNYEPLYTT